MARRARRRSGAARAVAAALAAVTAAGCTAAGTAGDATVPAASPSGRVADPGDQVGPVDPAPSTALDDRDLAALADASAVGAVLVVLVVVVEPGRSQSVADAAVRLGGAVEARNDRVGYLRLTVPLGAARPTVALPGVVDADVEVLVPRDDPRPSG